MLDSLFPLSGIFGCTRHSQASLPLLSLARKFSLLIYRHISALIGPSALRHRLYAEGRSQSLHIFRIPGRSPPGASQLTARRSKVLFFVEVQQHFSLLSREGSYWSCHSRRSRSYRHFPPLPSLSRQKIVCRRAYISRQSPKPCLCQTTVCIVVHRLDFPQNAPAPPTLPRPATFSDIRESLAVPSASTYIASLGYNHSALSFPSPLNVPRYTFCHAEYGVVAGLNYGAVWLFSLLSFLCLEVSVERCKPSHFSCYKGRTDRSAQNRHTDFCNNFIKNGTSLIFDRASLKILLKFLLHLTFSVLPILAT